MLSLRAVVFSLVKCFTRFLFVVLLFELCVMFVVFCVCCRVCVLLCVGVVCVSVLWLLLFGCFRVA